MFSTKTDLTVAIVAFVIGALPMFLIAYIAWEHIPAYRNYLSWSYSGWRLAVIPVGLAGAAYGYLSDRD